MTHSGTLSARDQEESSRATPGHQRAATILWSLLLGAVSPGSPVAFASEHLARENASTTDGVLSRPAHFDVPAGRVEITLNEFGTQADVQVLYNFDGMEKLRTHPVHGKMTPIVALQAMLEGTGLIYSVVDGLTLTVSRPASPPADAGTGSGRRGWVANNRAAAVPMDRRSPGTDLEVVTIAGTLSAPSPPPGSPSFNLERVDIDAMGLVTTQDVVHTLPQIFGGGPTEDTHVDFEATTNAGFGTGVNFRALGAGSTLVLMNGHRLASSGTEGLFTDISNLPLIAIERIDVIPESSSTLFGADAVGGVMNFVLRDHYPGRLTQAYFGSAMHGQLSENGVSQLVGLKTDTGHGLLAFDFYNRDDLPASRRAQATSDLREFGGTNFNTLVSSPGNVLVAGRTYPIPRGQDGSDLAPADFVATAPNDQNRLEGGDLLPSQRRYSGFGTWRADLTDHVTFFVDGMLNHREVHQTGTGFGGLFTVTRANPFFVDPSGTAADRVSVYYSFIDDLGPMKSDVLVKTGSITSGIDVRTDFLWHFTAAAEYSSESLDLEVRNVANLSALTDALADPNPLTAFNMFADGSHTDRGTIEKVRTSSFYASDSSSDGVSLKARGPLFHVSGGSVTLATGIDHRRQQFASETRSQPDIAPVTVGLDRDVDSVFAETRIPLWSEDNRRRGLERLELSAGVRREHYSDFGGTTAARYGLVWSPWSGIAMRGTWAQSFRPPGLTDLDERSNAIQIARDPFSTTPRSLLLIPGNNADLRPETARSWTAGLDLKPVRWPGFTAAFTYFNVDFTNRVWTPTLTNDILNDPRYGDLVIHNPTSDQLTSACRHVAGTIYYASCIGASVDAIVDLRVRNASRVRTQGVDLIGRYDLATRFGTFALGLNGTRITDFSEAAGPGSPLVQRLNTPSHPIGLRARALLGYQHRGWNISTFINYTDDYWDSTAATARHVASSTTLDLNATYTFPARETFWPGKTTIGVSAQNLLDRKPPFYNNPAGIGYDPENADLLRGVVRITFRQDW